MATTTIQQRRPFNLRYIIREPGGIHGDDQRATHRTAACNYRYIMRQDGIDEFGPTPGFAARQDLLDYGRHAPIGGTATALQGIALWQAADEHSRDRRPDQPTAMHIVGTLPENGDRASWRAMIDTVLEDEVITRGMICDWAIHVLSDDAGGYAVPPHFHGIVAARSWRQGWDPGRHMKPWFSNKSQVDQLGNAWYAITGLYPHDYRKAGSI